MSSEEEIWDMIEEKHDYGLIPEPAKSEAIEVSEQRQNITKDILDYALDHANRYWKEHLEENGQISVDNENTVIRYGREISDQYFSGLAKDIKDEYGNQLKMEDIFELVDKLMEMPEGEENKTPYNKDPRRTPENEEFPSMFQ